MVPQRPSARGTFGPGVHYATGTDPQMVAAADLDGDGRLDLVVSNTGSGDISIFIQDHANPGTFLPAVVIPVGGHPDGLAIGDLNGDGKPDIVVANQGRAMTTGSVSVLLQDPARPGVFLPAVNYAGVLQPLSVAIGDLNGDGKPDIAVADGDIATILFQQPQAPGKFLPPVKVGS